MIGPITSSHHAAILKMNADFVHWLAPLNQAGLDRMLERAAYGRQIDNGQGVLVGYADTVDYPDHENLNWLRGRYTSFFYIDRVIIAKEAHGRGYGQRLYDDVECFAREQGYTYLTCEVNTQPDNPGSHRFHLARGFEAAGTQSYPSNANGFSKAVKYYAKAL